MALEKKENSLDYSIAKERRVIATALLVVAVLTISDLIEDGYEGVSWQHVAVEGLIIFVSAVVGIYLFNKSFNRFHSHTAKLTSKILAAREDAKHWKEKTANVMSGLSIAIDNQFSNWGLTAAEKEVGLLLLKGLSHKEIANIRQTSEKTVRQQATSVYSKANLEGRAQLSAFFLEDLLLPTE